MIKTLWQMILIIIAIMDILMIYIGFSDRENLIKHNTNFSWSLAMLILVILLLAVLWLYKL